MRRRRNPGSQGRMSTLTGSISKIHNPNLVTPRSDESFVLMNLECHLDYIQLNDVLAFGDHEA